MKSTSYGSVLGALLKMLKVKVSAFFNKKIATL